MDFQFKILGSSSSGNCSLLKTKSANILIDVGFSGKKLEILLNDLGESLRQIDGVFITHEHADHIAGLRGLSKYPHIEIFANTDTASAAQSKVPAQLNWKIFETGSKFQFKNLEVQSFSIPHDAYDPVGFVFRCQEGGKSLAVVTDLGYVPQSVKEAVKDVDILLLEANYEDRLLEIDTKRPWPIKQRIKGRHGHLSNEAMIEFLNEIKDPSWKQVYLGHLSKDCNNPAVVVSRLENSKFPFPIEIINPNEGRPNLCLAGTKFAI